MRGRSSLALFALVSIIRFFVKICVYVRVDSIYVYLFDLAFVASVDWIDTECVLVFIATKSLQPLTH
jgi:hypothetical protein